MFAKLVSLAGACVCFSILPVQASQGFESRDIEAKIKARCIQELKKEGLENAPNYQAILDQYEALHWKFRNSYSLIFFPGIIATYNGHIDYLSDFNLEGFKDILNLPPEKRTSLALKAADYCYQLKQIQFSKEIVNKVSEYVKSIDLSKLASTDE